MSSGCSASGGTSPVAATGPYTVLKRRDEAGDLMPTEHDYLDLEMTLEEARSFVVLQVSEQAPALIARARGASRRGSARRHRREARRRYPGRGRRDPRRGREARRGVDRVRDAALPARASCRHSPNGSR